MQTLINKKFCKIWLYYQQKKGVELKNFFLRKFPGSEDYLKFPILLNLKDIRIITE